MRSILAVATTSWGLLMSLAPLLQLRLVLRRGTSAGVSIAWFGVLLVGFALWLSYGLATGDLPLVITNTASITVCGATLVVLLRYRRADDSPTRQTATDAT